MDSFDDGVEIAAVIAARAEEREQAADEQLFAGERDIFAVNLLGEGGEAARDVIAEIEKLEFFGGFFAAAHHAQVVHDALDGGLAEILRIAEEGEVGFGHEGRRNADDKQQQEPGRIPDQLDGPDQRGQGLLEKPAHLLDHGEAIGGLDPRAFEAVVEVGVLVGGEVEARGLTHDADANVVGVAIGEQGIAIVDGAGERAIEQREGDFGSDDPPEMRRQRLVVDGLFDAADDARGREPDGPWGKGDDHAQD